MADCYCWCDVNMAAYTSRGSDLIAIFFLLVYIIWIFLKVAYLFIIIIAKTVKYFKWPKSSAPYIMKKKWKTISWDHLKLFDILFHSSRLYSNFHRHILYEKKREMITDVICKLINKLHKCIYGNQQLSLKYHSYHNCCYYLVYGYYCTIINTKWISWQRS